LKKGRINEITVKELPILSSDLIFLEEPYISLDNKKLQKAFDKANGTYAIIKYYEKNTFYHHILLEDNISQKINEFSQNCFSKSLGIFKEKNDENPNIFMIFEGSFMTLDELLRLGKVFEIEELFPILANFIRGLSLLQYDGIALRNICPQSVLIFERNNKKIYKFMEYGLMANLPQGQFTLETSTIFGCIPNYSSPEVFEYCEKNSLNPNNDPELYNPFVSDVYSLGVLMIRMLGFIHARTLIQQGLLEQEEFQRKFEKILTILKNMLEMDPKKRLDFNQLESQISVNFGKSLSGFIEKQGEKNKERRYYEIYRENKAEESKQNSISPQSLYTYHRDLYEAFSKHDFLIKEAKFHLKKAFKIYEGIKENFDKTRKGSVFHDEDNSASIYLTIFDPKEEIFCLSRIGEIYLKLNDFKKSQFFLMKSLQMCEKYFGVQYEEDYDEEAEAKRDGSPLSPMILSSKANFPITEMKGGEYFAWSYQKLGSLYKEEGNFEKSADFFLRSFKIFKRISGENHEEIADIKANLGDLQFFIGNMRKAEEFYYKSLEITENVFGLKHEKSAEAYDRLALLYDNLGNLYKHQEVHVKTEGKYQEMINSCISLHPESLALSRNIKNLSKAEELYQKSLKIRLEIYSENNSKVADSYNNLGLLYDYLGDFNKAEENLQKALQIRLNLYGETDANTATTCNNLGLLSFNMGNYQKAEDFYQKALAIRIEKLGEKHSETATSYNNLGLLYETMKNYPQAKENLSRALRIFRNLFGENHCGTATSYNNLGLLCESMGNLEKAEDFYLKSLKIREFLYGKYHGDTATS